MIEMRVEFSEKTLVALKGAGWVEGREIETRRIEQLLKEEGYTVFPSVVTFLSEFGNLLIEFQDVNNMLENERFHFNVDKACESVFSSWILEVYAGRVNSQLCIIGQAAREHLVLTMDVSGRVFGGFDDLLYFLGDSGPAAIERLVCGGDKPVKIP
jgi:hypothetical protein